MPKTILLETERLTLRTFIPADIEDLHNLLSDPDVMRYYPEPLTREQSERWLQGILDDHQINGFGMLAVHLKDSGEYVGQAGVMRRQTDAGEVHYLAYLIRRQFWGHGYASEAARRVVENAFQNCGVEKVTALIDPLNARSIRLAERLGLQFESTIQHMGREHSVYTLTR